MGAKSRKCAKCKGVQPLFVIYAPVVILKKGCSVIGGRNLWFVILGANCDSILIEVVVFKVFGVD